MAQRYDPEFKHQAIRLVQEQNKPASVIARELGIPDKTLYKWLAAAKEDPEQPFVGSGHLKAGDQAMRDLQRRVRDLEEENAILKKAMRIFTHDRK